MRGSEGAHGFPIAKEIRHVRRFIRAGRYLEVMGLQKLATDDRFRDHADQMPTVCSRLIIAVGDGQAYAVNHDLYKVEIVQGVRNIPNILFHLCQKFRCDLIGMAGCETCFGDQDQSSDLG